MDDQTPSMAMETEGVTNADASAACGEPVSASISAVTQTQLPEQQQVASEQGQQRQEEDPQEEQLIKAFWSNQQAEIAQTTEFKTRSLPLPRIKKIMKSDEDVKRVAQEAPVVLAKACEMFIQELTLRAWHHTKGDKRRTLQKKDITTALETTELFDFLVDLLDEEKGGSSVAVPADEQKGKASVEAPTTAEQDDEDPYDYYYGECDCFSGPSSPDEPDLPPGVTCDDTRYYTYIHEYYSL